jgi:hypothetical protein
MLLLHGLVVGVGDLVCGLGDNATTSFTYMAGGRIVTVHELGQERAARGEQVEVTADWSWMSLSSRMMEPRNPCDLSLSLISNICARGSVSCEVGTSASLA